MSLWENDTGKKNCKNCEESCARAVLLKGVDEGCAENHLG